MRFKNIVTKHYTKATQDRLEELSEEMRQLVADKVVQLSKQERKKYSSVNERNKLIINKVAEYRDHFPELSSPYVDWDEYKAEHEDRQFLHSFLKKMNGIIYGMECIKMLYDYDNLKNARADYDHTKYIARHDVPGAMGKYMDLRQFFGPTSRSTT